MKTIYAKDVAKKKLNVSREFTAPLELTWRAWTEKEMLDEWWAPKPWKAQTKKIDFREGGTWLYAMTGPNHEKQWCQVDYKKIASQKSFTCTTYFCDENGVRNQDTWVMDWKVEFKGRNNATLVEVEVTFASEKDLNTVVSTGFEEGFAMAHDNLDQYLQAQFRLWGQLKPNGKARVVTYLNFPGNTEEAFKFYKSVFGTEFGGTGIQRFGDIPPDAGHPPVSESVKKMILHIELPILNGHMLMGTDAPKEMGMSVTVGNNMHVCLEPETKTETKKLFDALSQGGKVSMPLSDMFWGAYFGSFTDRFGINWMFNCVTAN